VFRNDKRKIFVVICDTDVAANQEVLAIACLPYRSSPSVYTGARVTRPLALYVCFVDRCLSFCTFFFCLFLVTRAPV
jgi:hypothetical protein